MISDENQEKIQIPAPSEELQEEEISLDGTSFASPDGIEDASLISDENQEKIQIPASSGELQEE